LAGDVKSLLPYSRVVLRVVTLPVLADGSPLSGAIRFAAESDGQRLASGELLGWSHFGDETGRLINVQWEEGQAEAARAVVETAVSAAGPGAELHLAANAEADERVQERLALFESSGFSLWQEKEGLWWADSGQELLTPDGVVVHTLAELGRERYTDVVARCTAGTLDRIDADESPWVSFLGFCGAGGCRPR
jgi:hypothetical protein